MICNLFEGAQILLERPQVVLLASVLTYSGVQLERALRLRFPGRGT